MLGLGTRANPDSYDSPHEQVLLQSGAVHFECGPLEARGGVEENRRSWCGLPALGCDGRVSREEMYGEGNGEGK